MATAVHSTPALAERLTSAEKLRLRGLLAIPGARRLLEDRVAFYIAILDLMSVDVDAEPDEDGEPSLGWAITGQLGGSHDREDDDQGDNTAPETHGKGFRRCALDDHEPDGTEELFVQPELRGGANVAAF